MKINPQLRPLAAGLQLAALALFVGQSYAGNTWDGGGGDNNWGTGANWSPDGSPAPGSGNDIFFGGSTRLSPFNNYTNFDDWRNITFNSGAGAFNLFGNSIDLFGKIENLSSNGQSVSLTSIALNSANNEFNPVNGNLTIFSTNIFTNGNQLKIFGNNGNTLTFSSGTVIQQGGSVSLNQNSTVIYNSAHTYTGDTFVNAGKLQFNTGSSATSTTIRIGDTSGSANAEMGLIAETGGQTLGNTIVSRAGSSGVRSINSQNTSGTNTLNGVIALDAAMTITQALGGNLSLSGSFFDVKQQALTVNALGSVDISKPLNSSFASGGSLIKQGSGTLVLSNTSNNYTGTNNTTLNANGTQIAAGTLAIAADTSLGLAPAGAYNNLQFTGTGTLRSNASISLNSNRNISIASAATATFDNNGNTLTVNGVINGTGGNLVSAGSGTTALTADNTYTGTTTISAGTLQIGNATSTGSLGSGAVTNDAALVFNRSGNFTLSNAISGSGSLAQSGSNTITIASANTYTGSTTVNSGTLLVSANQALGTAAAGTTVNSGAALHLSAVNYSTAEALSINGAGVGGTGSLYNVTGSSTYAGQITAVTNATIGAATGSVLTLTGGLVKDGTTLTVSGPGRVNVNTVGISGASANSDLIVNAASLVTTVASTYNGPTSVTNSGTLVANNTSGSATGTGNVTVSNNSTLSGTGAVNAGSGNFVTINGTLQVGDSTLGSPVASSLTLNSGGGSTVLGSGSLLQFDLFSRGGDLSGTASAADYIRLFGGLDATAGGTLVIANNGVTGFALGDKWRLFDLSGPGTISGMLGLDYSSLGLGPSLSASFDSGTGIFSIVPEPSRMVLLFMGTLGVMLRRRRR